MMKTYIKKDVTQKRHIEEVHDFIVSQKPRKTNTNCKIQDVDSGFDMFKYLPAVGIRQFIGR